jgi:hypothetical protein
MWQEITPNETRYPKYAVNAARIYRNGTYEVMVNRGSSGIEHYELIYGDVAVDSYASETMLSLAEMAELADKMIDEYIKGGRKAKNLNMPMGTMVHFGPYVPSEPGILSAVVLQDLGGVAKVGTKDGRVHDVETRILHETEADALTEMLKTVSKLGDLIVERLKELEGEE